jgi:hypothetical protein
VQALLARGKQSLHSSQFNNLKTKATMKTTKFIQTTTLLLTLLLPINYALADPAADIISWLDAASLKAAYDSATKNDVVVSEITPIKLTNGEDAYLASASMKDDTPLGYVLARPSEKKAILLENYNGGGDDESNDIVNLGSGDKGSVLIILSGGGGTGVYNKKLSIVKFDGWKVSVLHSSDSGYEENADCDKDFQAGMCERHDTFLNKLVSSNPDASKVVFVETKVVYDFKAKKPKVTGAKILSFPVGTSSESATSASPTQNEVFLNKIDYSKPTSENPDAPEKNPLSVETTVEQAKTASAKIK